MFGWLKSVGGAVKTAVRFVGRAIGFARSVKDTIEANRSLLERAWTYAETFYKGVSAAGDKKEALALRYLLQLGLDVYRDKALLNAVKGWFAARSDLEKISRTA